MTTAAIVTGAVRPRRRRRLSGSVPLVGILPVAVGLLAWQLWGPERSPVWPRPSSWLTALSRLAERDLLWQAVARTSAMFAIGLILCAALGLGIGLLVGSSRGIRRATRPLIDIVRSVPPPALIPAAVLLVPDATAMTLIVIVLAAVWPIVLNVSAAYAAIPPIRLESARMLQVGRRRTITRFVLPTLVPDIFLGIRIAAPIALVVTLATEFLGTSQGIGRQLVLAQSSFDAATVFGLLVVIALMGVALNQFLAGAEALLLRNRPPAGTR